MMACDFLSSGNAIHIGRTFSDATTISSGTTDSSGLADHSEALSFLYCQVHQSVLQRQSFSLRGKTIQITSQSTTSPPAIPMTGPDIAFVPKYFVGMILFSWGLPGNAVMENVNALQATTLG